MTATLDDECTCLDEVLPTPAMSELETLVVGILYEHDAEAGSALMDCIDETNDGFDRRILDIECLKEAAQSDDPIVRRAAKAVILAVRRHWKDLLEAWAIPLIFLTLPKCSYPHQTERNRCSRSHRPPNPRTKPLSANSPPAITARPSPDWVAKASVVLR